MTEDQRELRDRQLIDADRDRRSIDTDASYGFVRSFTDLTARSPAVDTGVSHTNPLERHRTVIMVFSNLA